MPSFVTVGFYNWEEIDSLKLKQWPVAKKKNTYYLASIYPQALAFNTDVLLQRAVNYILTLHGFKPKKPVVIMFGKTVESDVTKEEEEPQVGVSVRPPKEQQQPQQDGDEHTIPDLVDGNDIVDRLIKYALSAKLYNTEAPLASPALKSRPPVQMEPFPRTIYSIPMFPATLLYHISSRMNPPVRITTHTIIRARRFMGAERFKQHMTVAMKLHGMKEEIIEQTTAEFETWYGEKTKEIRRFQLLQKLPFTTTHSGYLCDVPGVDKTLNDGQISIFLTSILGKTPTNYSDLYERVMELGGTPSNKDVAIATLGRKIDSLPHLKRLFDTTTIAEFIFS
jgi:hypothetical protein